MKETKKQIIERVVSRYISQYNAVPDYEIFKGTLASKEEKAAFTESAFLKKFYEIVSSKETNPKIQKQLIKDIKSGALKTGHYNLDTLQVLQKELVGSRFGKSKFDKESILSIAGTLSSYKTLYNKKNGLPIMKVFSIVWDKPNRSLPGYVFVSNEYGIHFRTADCFLGQFTETAALRKMYEVK